MSSGAGILDGLVGVRALCKVLRLLAEPSQDRASRHARRDCATAKVDNGVRDC